MTTAAASATREATIHLEGELTIYTVAETLARLRAELAGRSGCSLDLSGVSEVDGAGLQLLLWVKQTSELSGDFRLSAHSAAVAEVLGLLHLKRRFGIEPAGKAEEGPA